MVERTANGSLRVIQYTPEGGPIYKELRYNGGKLVIAYDTTEDDFGPKETGTFVCTALNREDESTVLKYTLTGCEGEYRKRRCCGSDSSCQRWMISDLCWPIICRTKH